MRQAIVLDADDIKNILAEIYHISSKDVVRSQYSYTVILPNTAAPIHMDEKDESPQSNCLSA